MIVHSDWKLKRLVLVFFELIDLPIELHSVHEHSTSVLEEGDAMLGAIKGHIV